MKEGKARYLAVLLSTCGILCTSIGMITNVAGLFFEPIAEELSVGRGAVSMTLTICNILFALGGFVAPRLLSRLRLNRLILIGTGVIVGATVLLSLSGSLRSLYFLNAVRGFAAGTLGFVLVTMIVNHWFHEKTAFAIGIVMASSGLIGAVLSPALSFVVQRAGWRVGYLAVSLIMLLLNLPAYFFIPSIDPRTRGYLPYGEKAAEGDISDKGDEGNTRMAEPGLFALATVFLYAVCGTSCTGLPQHFPGIAAHYALSASVGALMLSAALLVNTGGKLLLGWMIDCMGTVVSTALYIGGSIAAILGLMIFRNPEMIVFAAALYGLIYSLGTVALVSMTKDIFGIDNYEKVYPIMSLGSALSNSVFASVIGFQYDYSGGYNVSFFMLIILLIVALCSMILNYFGKAAKSGVA